MSNITDPKLKESLELWNSFKKPKYLEAETKEALEKFSENDLQKLFLKRLSFGTSGIRSKMGVGFNAMNVVTILQITQGLCQYLIDTHGLENCKTRGIILGFDGRHHSESFAHVCAAVFLTKGISVYVFSQTAPTPVLCYANIKKKCICGVMITASHNPKSYNGYKVYMSDGAPIIHPADKEVINLMLTNFKAWDGVMSYLNDEFFLKDRSLVNDPYYEIYDSFMNDMKAEFHFSNYMNSKTKLNVVYSPLHGIGRNYVHGIMHLIGFSNLLTVPEQALPNAEFPTLSLPNPEEKGALDLAMQMAEKNNSPMVVANDPDADRFACAEKHDGKWKIFTGDELGIIFAHHIMQKYNKMNICKEKHVFICTNVCSKMLKTLCEKYGYAYCETLTGFKWLINKAMDMSNSGYTVLYCYEEALGHALTKHVKDKCGISSLACWIDMAVQLYEKGMSCHDYLESIRKDIGYFVSNNGYYIVLEPDDVDKIFDDFRNGGNYHSNLGPHKIVHIKDLTKGYDSLAPDKKSPDGVVFGSQVIALVFENTATITMRTSGTEAKIKWYAEVSKGSYNEAKTLIDTVVNDVMDVFMKPDKYKVKRA